MVNTIYKQLVFSLIPFLGVICCCNNPTDPERPLNYINNKTYISNESKMTLTVPNNWNLSIDTIINGYSVKVCATKKINSFFQPNLTIIWNAHSGSTEMNEILNQLEALIKQAFIGTVIISKQIVLINGKQCGELVFDFTMNGYTIREKQIYAINNNLDIVLTFADIQSNYVYSSPDFDSIQSSIRFTN